MIRKAVLEDSETINTISEELGYGKEPQENTDNRIRTIINSTFDELFIFEENAIINGWIHFFIANRVTYPSFIEIGELVVSSQFRRKGIGKELVDYAMNWAKERNLKTRVRCNSKRVNTHEFYKAIGFSKTKEQNIFEIK